MKSLFRSMASLAGLALTGPLAATTLEFYDIVDGDNQPVLTTSTLIGGTLGLPALTTDIFTNLAAWTGYTATLEVLLSDDGDKPDGEHAVVANLINKQIEIAQDTTARWYTWEGDVGAYLQTGLDSLLFFSESVSANPDGKDFFYYNARLVLTAVPEASEWLLLGIGALLVGGVAHRRRQDAAAAS